jgi:hypothetical protein
VLPLMHTYPLCRALIGSSLDAVSPFTFSGIKLCLVTHTDLKHNVKLVVCLFVVADIVNKVLRFQLMLSTLA